VIIDLDLTAQEEAMSALLWAGTIVGAACGLGHGVYVYGRVSRDDPTGHSWRPESTKGDFLCALDVGAMVAVWRLCDGLVDCRMLLLYPKSPFGPTIHSSPDPR
jgi:hypothetical protein